MGFFDKLKSGLDTLNEGVKTAGKYVDNYVDDQISKSSDSRLLDVYNRTESSRLKEKLENELRSRGHPDFDKNDNYDY